LTEHELTEEGEVPERVIRTLLVSDLVSSTALIGMLGDARAAEVFQRHDRLARNLLSTHDGVEIDKTDGFLLLFERPLDAVLYALAYHQELQGLSAEVEAVLTSRVGIHLGEVYLRRNPDEHIARGAKPIEVEGLAKAIAARLMSVAGSGQTLLTRGAFDLARRAAVGEIAGESLKWLAHGRYVLKGVDEPVDLFEVGRADQAPLMAPADSDKVKRLVGDESILGWRPAPEQVMPGRKHWRLESKLGEGGFGEVWLARHTKTGERRVFKLCFEAAHLRSLRREVTLFRLLKEELGERHDIARVLDWSFDEPPYYLESEYAVGGSLIEWADEQGGIDQVPLSTRLELVAQAAEALGAAHSVGVLHKDVKPRNILVRSGPDGAPQVCLTDFGIGMVTDRKRLEDAGITVLGLTELDDGTDSSSGAGSRLYMAPEVLEGKASSIQADVYALGVVLYQMVVGDLGRALAPGWRRDVEDELLQEEIAACVDGSPQRRRGHVLQIAENLRRLEERRQARDAERRKRERSRRARRLRRVGTVALVLLTVVAGLMGLLWSRSEVARQEATAAANHAEAVQLQALGQLQLDTYPTAALAYSIASLEREYTPTSRLLALRALWRGPPCFVANWEDGFQVAFSPDGRYLAVGESEPGNTLLRDDGLQLTIPSGAGLLAAGRWLYWRTSNAFAPSSNALLTCEYSSLENVNLSIVPTGETLFAELVEGAIDFLWLTSPDGDRLRMATRFDGTAMVVDWLVDQKERRTIATIELGGAENDRWFFSADGRWLVGAVGRELRALPILADTGQAHVLGRHPSKILDLSRHPSEPLFATVDGSRKLRLWSVGRSDGEPERILNTSMKLERVVGFGGGGSVVIAGKDSRWVAWRLDDFAAVYITGKYRPLDVGPSGRYVAVPFLNETIRVWDFDGPPAADPVTLRRGRVNQMNSVAFHCSGRWLASADPRGVAVWPSPDKMSRILKGHTGKVQGLVFGPDGSWLASSAYDGIIRLWAMKPGESEPVKILVKEEKSAHFDLAVDASGSILFAGEDHGRLCLAPVSGGQPTAFRMDTQTFFVAVSPDGNLVAAAASGEFNPDHTYVRVWRADTGDLVRSVDSGNAAWGVQLLPDGDLLTGGGTGLTRWNLETGESEVVIAGAVSCIGQVLSSDGRRLLYHNRKEQLLLHIADLETGATRALPAFSYGYLRALSRSGEIVACVTSGGIIEVGLVDGGEPHLLLGHTGTIHALAIDPTGHWIASASDETIRLWPMPDLNQPPLHTLPREELLAKLRQLTNLRVVPDDSSPDGFRLDVGPFPGWRTMPPSW
jgi:WD40 repeat protein/serine/threonine protein kinase/class 3 adenylate cyclase